MHLRDKDKLKLEEIFGQIKEPIEILAYGSRVNGYSHDASDLDLVYRRKDKKSDATLLVNLKTKLEESNIPITVELRDWYMLPESFHQQIEEKNELLYKNY
jgi:predicted nucleotidyltransferase